MPCMTPARWRGTMFGARVAVFARSILEITFIKNTFRLQISEVPTAISQLRSEGGLWCGRPWFAGQSRRQFFIGHKLIGPNRVRCQFQMHRNLADWDDRTFGLPCLGYVLGCRRLTTPHRPSNGAGFSSPPFRPGEARSMNKDCDVCDAAGAKGSTNAGEIRAWGK